MVPLHPEPDQDQKVAIALGRGFNIDPNPDVENIDEFDQHAVVFTEAMACFVIGPLTANQVLQEPHIQGLLVLALELDDEAIPILHSLPDLPDDLRKPAAGEVLMFEVFLGCLGVLNLAVEVQFLRAVIVFNGPKDHWVFGLASEIYSLEPNQAL